MALGVKAKRYLNSALLVIDEVGFRPLDRQDANLLRIPPHADHRFRWGGRPLPTASQCAKMVLSISDHLREEASNGGG